MGLIVPDYPIAPWNITTTVYISTSKGEVIFKNGKYNDGVWSATSKFNIYRNKEDRIADPSRIICQHEVSIDITPDQMKSLDMFQLFYSRLLDHFPNGIQD